MVSINILLESKAEGGMGTRLTQREDPTPIRKDAHSRALPWHRDNRER